MIDDLRGVPNLNPVDAMKLTLIQLYNTFVQQGQIWYRKKRKMAYAPTTLPSVAASIPPELNIELTLIDEGVEVVNWDEIEADVVGLSVMTPSAPRAYAMANYLRSKGITTIMGGFHPTLMPDEAEAHADAIVIGFAEQSFPRLLKDLMNKRLKKRYQEPCDGVFCHQMPVPLREKLKQHRYFLPNSIELTRGCVNSCSFCSIPSFCKKQYLKRDIPQIIDELEKFKGKRVTFLDSSPTEDLSYIKAFYRALIPLKITWYSCITLKVADDEEWLDLAARSGCKGVLVGFESLEEESIRSGKKHFNDTGKYEYLIRRLHSRGIAVLGTFMFGFDADTRAIFERTVRFVDRVGLDLVHYAINTPFPGTPEFDRLDSEKRILTRDWARYDGTQAVYKPQGMTVEELQRGYYWAFKKSHTLSSIFHRTWKSEAGSVFSLASNIAFRQLSNVLVPKSFNYHDYTV